MIDLEKLKIFISSTRFLKTIFDDDFFKKIEGQLQMIKSDPAGQIHPVYNLLMIWDADNNFKNLETLEQYLKLIFNHPTIKLAQKNDVIKKLKSFDQAQSLNMLLEISILGLLLSKLPSDKIHLYPNTVDKKGVEVRIKLKDREIYIDVTALNDSKSDQDSLAQMLRSGIRSKSESRSIPYILSRVQSRVAEKSSQFIPKQPNVVIIFYIGTHPLPPIEWGLNNLLNIGLVLGFSRQRFSKEYIQGCDPECKLTNEEIELLKSIFNPSSYTSIIY